MLAYCGGSKVGTWQTVKVPFVAQWRDSATGIYHDINQILVRAGSINTRQTTDFLFDDVSLNLRY